MYHPISAEVRSMLRILLVFAVLTVFVVPEISAAERPANRVLFIGLDGTRPDALRAAKAPNLQGLIADGAVSYSTNIVGTNGDKADTVSGPGWSNLLTGVWPDKHGVTNNTFKNRNYENYPHFFARVREAYPSSKLYSYVTWTPIKQYVVSAADES